MLECFGFNFFERSEKKNREEDDSVSKHTEKFIQTNF
jgi:hypothetical protein